MHFNLQQLMDVFKNTWHGRITVCKVFAWHVILLAGRPAAELSSRLLAGRPAAELPFLICWLSLTF
jgi:hypothetical protein